MLFPVSSRGRLLAGACLVTGMLATASACVDEPGAPTPDVEEAELQTGHIGHVQVIVQPRQDDFGPAPAVRIEARFAEYRGLDHNAARLRANVPPDPAAGLSVGECVPSDRFDLSASEIEDERELTFIDGGDLRVTIGGHDFVVPLALVPDLLEWVSGVEYVHVSERMPEINAAPDGITPVSLRLEGSTEAELPGFELSLDLPRALELLPAVESPSEDADTDGALLLRWQPPGESTDTLLLQLSAYGEVAAIGDEVTCLVWDSGEARLDMTQLHTAGLADADLVRVTARRISTHEVSTGAFDGVDVVVELRDQLFVPAP